MIKGKVKGIYLRGEIYWFGRQVKTGSSNSIGGSTTFLPDYDTDPVVAFSAT